MDVNKSPFPPGVLTETTESQKLWTLPGDQRNWGALYFPPSTSSSTHPCRWTAPQSLSTARWAGCSSPPCPPAEPCHRKHPGTGLTVPPRSPDPDEERRGEGRRREEKRGVIKTGNENNNHTHTAFLFNSYIITRAAVSSNSIHPQLRWTHCSLCWHQLCTQHSC